MQFPVGEITFSAVSNSLIEAVFKMKTITPVSKSFLFLAFIDKYVHCIMQCTLYWIIRVLSIESFPSFFLGTNCFLLGAKDGVSRQKEGT